MQTQTYTLRDALPAVITDSLPGPKAAEILERKSKAVPDAVKSIYPLVMKRGEGAMVEDVDGNTFIDWVGGVGVMNVGYSQPEIIEAVKAQSEDFSIA